MKKLMMSLTLIAGMMLALPFNGQAQECQNEKKKEKADQSAFVQKGDYEKSSFKVDGNCSMCKARIEEAAATVKGVKKASWDKQTHQLTLSYHKDKVKLMDVHEKIAAAGHNTSKVEGDDKAYQALPACCKYREE